MKQPKTAICLRVPLKLKEAIEREAERQKSSINQTITDIIAYFLLSTNEKKQVGMINA